MKIYKIHKISGLSGGILLLLLAITGFLLNHGNWNFLYTTTFETESITLLDKDKRLFESYYVDKNDEDHIIVATKRGLYESDDGGLDFERPLNIQATNIQSSKYGVYVSTSDGLYKSSDTGWKNVLLKGIYLTSLSIHNNIALAVEEKKYIYTIDLSKNVILNKTTVEIATKDLQSDIPLSRIVRDLHVGGGLFDDGISVLLNDYAALFLIFLALSGYYVWYLIKTKRSAKRARKLIKLHSNIFAILAALFLIILAITGVVFNHKNEFRNFMRTTQISYNVLPPIYRSLKEDIWAIDYDGENYRVGNRLGVYKSQDLSNWTKEDSGFAYRMNRLDGKLFVSGMSSTNRFLENDKYTVIPRTPQMFRNVINIDNEIAFLHFKTTQVLLPEYENVTLYSIILAIHDGSFFSTWWFWLYDYAAFTLIVLSLTGTYRWYIKKRSRRAKS